MPPGTDRGQGERETKSSSKSGHSRTEFVIFFIWLAPPPSDALRGVCVGGGDTPAPAAPQR